MFVNPINYFRYSILYLIMICYCDQCHQETEFRQKSINWKILLLAIASLIGWVFYLIYYFNKEAYYCASCKRDFTTDYVQKNSKEKVRIEITQKDVRNGKILLIVLVSCLALALICYSRLILQWPFAMGDPFLLGALIFGLGYGLFILKSRRAKTRV